MAVSFIALLVGLFIFLIIILVKNIYTNHQEKVFSQIIGSDTTTSPLRKNARIDIGKKLKSTGGGNALKKGSISDLLQQAGYKTAISRYWLYSFITAFIVVLFCRAMHTAPLAMILFGFTGLFGLPKLYLKFKAGRRQKRFLEEFPDALDAMVRLLKAGMPVSESIAMASREFVGPVGEEMSYLYEQQRIGVNIADAAERVAQHIPIPEAQMFSTALAIQMETGASLSEVLTNLSGVIRARFRLKRKVVALSSEARSSAMIIGALPISVGLLLKLVNPEYMSMLFEDRTGHVLLWGCAVWMSIGILVMRQMINFRV